MTGFSRIALIGFGEVGQTLAADLIAAGAAVSAFDILFAQKDSVPARALEKIPVRKAASAADAVNGVELVISAVTAASDLDAARSAAPFMPRGAFYLDLNSVSPGMKQSCAEAIGAAGVRYVEAAVMTPIAPKRIASPMLLDLSDSGIAVVEEHVCVSHRLKTGVPFRAFARIGATLGNGSAEEITALGDFFLALGTAYQAIDDVINVAGLHNNTKERGEDLRTGRITLPVVHFLRAAAQPQREILLAEFQAATTDAPTHGRLLDSLAGSGVLDLCRTQARLAVRSELRALARTFPHADLQPLDEFATLVIEDYY